MWTFIFIMLGVLAIALGIFLIAGFMFALIGSNEERVNFVIDDLDSPDNHNHASRSSDDLDQEVSPLLGVVHPKDKD